MNQSIMTRGFPWGEPAHPGIIKQYEDLIALYKLIRGQYQTAIDQAFDRVSREIGFVVTTTIPVTLEMAENKPRWTVASALQGSLFEKSILSAVTGPSPEPWKTIPAGKYSLYLVWYDALRLKLRKDWLEPVHYLRADVVQQIAEAAQVRPEVQEPAHWFHPAATIPAEEKVLISVIDEVYPELRLADRVAMTRQALRQVVRPEVQEPAHLRPSLTADLALREISQLFKTLRVHPEPAHFRLAERDVLAEIQSLLSKYGV